MRYTGEVVLRRASDAPLRVMDTRYGSLHDAETLLEQTLLAGERRVRLGTGPSPPQDASAQQWRTLAVLLDDLSAYGALGSAAGADARFCQRLQPLLTRLVRCIVKGGFDVAHDDAEAAVAEVDALLLATSRALSNCSDGVARRCADTVLEVHRHATPCTAEAAAAAAAAPPPSLRVCFGLADYASGETGAMLWAGAVALSLVIIESFDAVVAAPARNVRDSAGRPLRVIELGCGPALVSLVLASVAAAHDAAVPCALDVTDVSATVVEEARQSFQRRNGQALAAMVSDGDEQVFHVRLFNLDFSAIPDELREQYDVVVASDVVYDHAIAAHVAPALEALLRPGGVALLCCEAHRDGMQTFTERIRAGHPDAPHLRVTQEARDVQEVLRELQMLTALSASTCCLMRIEKTCSS
ncbi:putative methyltransferase [Novymonas esmeraldas]|uniref:Methyltransferase n=1 Tax=Novymonas esmeraldas TaxID=1808958 RepID=A0AAW0EVR3_9TRYP